MHDDKSTPLLVVPQRQIMRSVFLANASLTFFVGTLGGFADTVEGRVVWWILSGVWFLRYLWAQSVPYIRLTDEELVVAKSPFSQAGASIDGTFDLEAMDDSELVIDHGSGLKDRISLRGIPETTRSQLRLGLERLRDRAVRREEERHQEFVATWGVDPSEVSAQPLLTALGHRDFDL